MMHEVRTQGILMALLQNLLGLAHTHLGLLSIELEEEKERWLRVVLLAGLMLLLLGMGILSATLALLLFAWHSGRWWIIWGLPIVFLLSSGMLYWRLRVWMDAAPPVFAATLSELRKHRDLLS